MSPEIKTNGLNLEHNIKFTVGLKNTCLKNGSNSLPYCFSSEVVTFYKANLIKLISPNDVTFELGSFEVQEKKIHTTKNIKSCKLNLNFTINKKGQLSEEGFWFNREKMKQNQQ